MLFCALKWLLSAFVLPVVFVAVVSGIVIPINALQRAYRNREEKFTSGTQRVLWRVGSVAENAFTWAAWTLIGCFVLFIFVGSAFQFMPYWGCDHCLPEFLQTQCKASEADGIRLQDAAEVRKLCDKWGWAAPDMATGAK